MPANSPAMLQNADIFEADGIIFDLEDAVLSRDKDAARDLLTRYLKAFGKYQMEYIVRINAMDSDFFKDDIKAIISDDIDTILLRSHPNQPLKSFRYC
jgi:citrate lyase subunit beta / citryl-CoA lyase